MDNLQQILQKCEVGFDTLSLNPEYSHNAIKSLREWLTEHKYSEYRDQIIYLINNNDWGYLLDSFYKDIPFGTGGRRGEVGLGPNRINEWTIRASAQGHAQYLLQKYGDEARERGLVFTYDVRIFDGNSHLSPDISSPLDALDGYKLSCAAAEVYAANGIKIYTFDGVRTTPELSFAIRYLNTIGGIMFSASHNPPDHNGKKIYDQTGGQLIPPHDQDLVEEVTQRVKDIQRMNFNDATNAGLVFPVADSVDKAYIEAVSNLSCSFARDIHIVYSPLHGCGVTSVLQVLTHAGFQVDCDPETSNKSGKFEHITFNIPNPEVAESFDTSLMYAKNVKADILINSDPDADRIGLMVNHHGKWEIINGNEISCILTEFAIRKFSSKLSDSVVITTMVTTDLVSKICRENNVNIVDNLLVGYKYIAHEITKLEDSGHINQFIFSCEESNGYLAGNYARDKDAAIAALWLAELAAELKMNGETIVDYKNKIYLKYGYYINYLTEIRMLGAVGFENIRTIQRRLRESPPKVFGKYIVENFEDLQQRLPILSETDFNSKDMLVYVLKPYDDVTSIKVTVRPSGTEPKIKMYFQLSGDVTSLEELNRVQTYLDEERLTIEKAVMDYCYSLIGITFPERGYHLFWQLPLDDKLKYFEIEDELAELNKYSGNDLQDKFHKLVSFLGSDPIEKVTRAFEIKYGMPLRDYLGL